MHLKKVQTNTRAQIEALTSQEMQTQSPQKEKKTSRRQEQTDYKMLGLKYTEKLRATFIVPFERTKLSRTQQNSIYGQPNNVCRR